MKMKRFLNLNFLLLALTVNVGQLAHAVEVSGKNGMVVTAHPLASEFGLEILKSGGNAVDAAVGAAIVAGVVEPNASGFGGGGAMLIYQHELDSLTYINYYACAPQAVAENFNPATESSSARAVLIPGTVAGLWQALQNYGTVNWEQLIQSAIKKVAAGYAVNENLYKIIFDSYEKLILYPQTRDIYLPDDLPPAQGTVIQNHRLLVTLEKLAKYGPEIFYNGEIADSIETAIRRHGGTLSRADLSNYRIRELAPLRGSYRGYHIASAPAPQSGSTLIESLNIFEFKDLSKMGDFTGYAATLHFMAEALKRADADRQEFLGDPNFVTVPSDVFISKQFAASRFATINFQQAVPADPKQTPAGDIENFKKTNQGNTTHISVVDNQGNAVSLTQTLNHFWGSGICVEGFLLNNGMTGFSGNPANSAAAGKQPRSTIAPTMIFKGDQLFMIIGTPGAGQIISTMAEVICNVIDFGKGADQANNDPRFSSRKWWNTLPLENRFSPALTDSLKMMGHPVQILGELDLFFGGVQLIVVDVEKKIYYGSSDPRRSGVAMGY